MAAASQVLISRRRRPLRRGMLVGARGRTATRTRRLPSADAMRQFERGDLFHVDCYGSYGGYFFDFARSRCVGDDPTARAARRCSTR